MQMLPRRQFLRQTLAATGLAALGHPLFGEERPRASFGLGFTLYGMKSLALGEALKTCAQIGYDSVELCLLDGYPTETKRLSVADRSQLRADLAPDAPPPLETVLGGKPAEWDQVKDKMAERLHAWAETAAAAKIIIAIKAHIMSAVQDPERLLWLLDAVKSPAIQATYDYSHFQLQNLGMEETIATLLPHTRFIHVKDGRLSPDGKVEFLLPGEGTTDYGAMFRKFQALGYRGDVVVEVSAMLFKKPDYDPKAAAEKSFAALRAGMEKAGLIPGR